MELYPYQKRVLETIQSNPSKRQLISMPTGTGKTVTFLSVAKELGLKTLILVHREELISQTYDKAKLLNIPEAEISTITAKDKQEIKQITIAMVQTLGRNLEQYLPDDIQMVIVDEAHHATAPSYRKILDHFRIINDEKWLLGFTATPMRGDGECLSSLFDVHSFKMTLSEATLNGYICPVRGLRIEMERKLDDIETVQGDYDIVALEKVMNCPEVNECIANRARHLKYLPGVVFCTSVDHAKEVAKSLRKVGKKAISISYKTSEPVKKKIFQMLKEGRIDFLTNAIKLSEGFDFPPIQTVILARPTRSPVLYKQMIGRGLRKADGKHECIVMEFAGNDEKMIRWEDIDENATFQSTSPAEQKSKEEAFNSYRSIFRSPKVKVVNVRVSPFDFYECYMQRVIHYRKTYRYSPFEDGFLVMELHKKSTKSRMSVYNFYVNMFFWKERYQSFYQFCEPAYLWWEECGHEVTDSDKMMLYFMNKQAHVMGRWYPSDTESMRAYQKKHLPNFKGNARTAEMAIEEYFIKKAIDKYVITKKVPLNLNELMTLT